MAINQLLALLKASGLVKVRRIGQKVNGTLAEDSRSLISHWLEWSMSRPAKNTDLFPRR